MRPVLLSLLVACAPSSAPPSSLPSADSGEAGDTATPVPTDGGTADSTPPLATADTGPTGPVAALVEPGEWLPGGEAGTNLLLLSGNNAFKLPMPGLSDEHEALFYSGNSWFNQSWVSAPSTTTTRDGLGPLYHGTSCSSCHLHDGRGAPPDDGLPPLAGLLLRLGAPNPGADPVPDPIYGGQLQDVAILGHLPEAEPRITWEPIEGTFADGTPYTLMAPTYHLDAPAYGAFDDATELSPRVAPQMIGLGLLEAIDPDHLLEAEDPDDLDGDGISGRAQWRVHPLDGTPMLGRFGWKGDAPTIEVQAAAAFRGDMGLTSRLFPTDDCTEAQLHCQQELSGGDPEVGDDVLERVVLYSRALAVPGRRAYDDPEVLLGKGVFAWLGCDGCHTPSHPTGPFAPLPELEGQTIWPYTDLLLHDMGEGLADGLPVGEASVSEWQTPPLWGLGLVPSVNGHSRYLHDGRARSLEEAVLWHGGEAQSAADAYRALPAEQRRALLRFLEDL